MRVLRKPELGGLLHRACINSQCLPGNSNLPGDSGALEEATVSVSVLASHSVFPMSGEYLPACLGGLP